MLKLIALVFVSVFGHFTLLAQTRISPFEIELTASSVIGSRYNEVVLLDLRPDTTCVGVIQKGALSTQTLLVAQKPLTQQFSEAISFLNGKENAGKGTLLIQLRQMAFAEISSYFSEKGYFYFHATAYEKADSGKYYPLHSIDTVLVVKGGDITKALLRNGNQIINQFIATSIISKPSNESYNYQQVLRIDIVEKLKTVLYTTKVYQDGLYKTFESFKNQQPEVKTIHARVVEGKLYGITGGIDGADKSVKLKNYYAVVYEGQPYIITDFGHYPLKKEKGDFYFTGKAPITIKTEDAFRFGFMAGFAGVYVPVETDATFVTKIDHLTGGFIRMKQLLSSESNKSRNKLWNN